MSLRGRVGPGRHAPSWAGCGVLVWGVALIAAACVPSGPARAPLASTPAPATAFIPASPTPTPQPPSPTVTPTATRTPAATPEPTRVPARTPAPTPVPAGGWIAFSAFLDGNWDIYAVQVSVDPARAGEMIRLTADPAEDRYPAFSPDGRTLAFASRRDGFWNLYTLAASGTIAQLTDDPAYDGAPAWSPDGKRIAFDSMRSGNLDVWVMDLAGGQPVNLTAGSPAGECDPAWSPDGTRVAYTSWRYGDQDIFVLDLQTGEERQLTSSPADEHLAGWRGNEIVYTAAEGERQEAFVRTVDLPPDAPGRRLMHWSYVDAPALAPDSSDATWGGYLAFLNRQAQGSRIYLQRPGVPLDLATRLTPELSIAGPLAWTGAAGRWKAAEGDPVALYEERTSPGKEAPYALKAIEGVAVGNPWLSDRVDDSFRALRQRVLDESGHDFLSQLSDAWREIGFDSSRSSYTSWHKAGRAIDTLLDYFSPDGRQRWLEIVLEPGGGEVYFRLYLRCAAQDGSQGAPLKVRPWDATAYARENMQGGRRKDVPGGYYVDLTDLMSQYGWERIAAQSVAGFHWHTDFVAMEYWHFQKMDGLRWYDAMLELVPPQQMERYHRWEVQQRKGMSLSLAVAQGIPLPWKERRMLEKLAP